MFGLIWTGLRIMVSLLRTGILLLVCGVCLAGNADAQDRRLREIFISLAHPTQIRQIDDQFDTTIEKILSKPLWDVQASRERIPLRDGYARQKRNAKVPGPALLPGGSLGPASESWTRIASLKPMVPATRRPVTGLLDADRDFFQAGELVGNPVNIFSGFEISVDRAKYTLELYGMKNGDGKTLLYSCRTGLGSPDYPTPKGTYYIVRIFDDHPLWIPPPSDWAYGQAPSHSVYGGHMMPFFSKIQVADKGEETVAELDNIAPQVKMVDGGMYRIHGTDSPWSIGSSQSHGCVRLLNSTVRQLAETLKMYVGTTSRSQTANGTYINLAKPVKLVLH